jgi:hypothetical protein
MLSSTFEGDYRFLGSVSGPKPASGGTTLLLGPLLPRSDCMDKSIGRPMVAEGDELYPLPLATRSEIMRQAKRG